MEAAEEKKKKVPAVPETLKTKWKNFADGLPCPPPGDLPNPGIKPASPALQVDSL